jgi:hypothetical protein
MMKKTLILWLAVCFIWVMNVGFVNLDIDVNVYGQVPLSKSASTSTQTLKTLVEEGRWKELPAFFSDDSYRILEDYFSTSKSIKIITSQLNNLTYKVKFTHQGEIGVITFQEKEGKYSNLKIGNQIRPLYFIEKFKKYRAVNVTLSVGNAKLNFINGYFYETVPFDWLILFKGKWNFYIKPDDREERLTLIRNFKRDYFSHNSLTGIFILTKKDFLKGLISSGEVTLLDKDLQSLYQMFRNAYGIEIKQFKEYWYLPFPQETNLVAFKNDKKSFYYYSYNQNLVPDTQLAVSESNRLILNYNLHKGLKFSFIPKQQVSEVQLSIFFNPWKNYISGTTTIIYKEPSSLRVLELGYGLKLVGNLDLNSKGLNVFRKRDKYYLMGSESKSLALYYNGYIKPSRENFELFKSKEDPVPKDSEDCGDIFYFLSRTHNFYPNPGSDFFKTDITVTVPESLNCLVSGNLVEKTVKNATVFRYTSNASKGISLITGNFKLAEKVNAQIPIHLYIPDSFEFPKNLDISEIKEAANLFIRTFGAIDLSTINILLKQGKKEGGVSNNGFIVVNLPKPKKEVIGSALYITPTARIDPKKFSPILIRDRSEDHIIHELAHQWWGGIISWKSYQDVWITEGLAHFSVLYFLKHTVSERRFNRFINKLKRWAFRYNDTGPIIYGSRINLLEKKYEAYQSVVYNKSALVFFMLMDLIGEKEFTRRLKSVLDKYKYRSISSMQFIREFCNNDDMLLKFFQKWVYSRAIPLVELSLLEDDKEYDKKEFKKVVISIKQLGEKPDTDFIFPLKLRVTTNKEISSESVIIKEKEQRFVITRDSTIRTIDILDDVALVKEKKQPSASRYRYK